MTVKELINRLQQINDKEMRVVVNGYESGFDDIENIKFVIAHEKIDNKWWDGKYEISENGGMVMAFILRKNS